MDDKKILPSDEGKQKKSDEISESADQQVSDSAGSVIQPTSEPETEVQTPDSQSNDQADTTEATNEDEAVEIPQPEFDAVPETESADTIDSDVAEEAADQPVSEPAEVGESVSSKQETETPENGSTDQADTADTPTPPVNDNPNAKWYVVHTFSGHENKVATNLKQRIDSEHLENRIIDILVPTQDKIEIRGGKKEQVKEKIFPGYILVKMDLDDASWLAVRTTQGVTAFVGMNNKPTPISEREVQSIVKFMTQGAPATFKDVFMVDDTVKIIDGPFTDFIGKVESVDKEKGKVRVLVSIFGRETPVELDFLQVTKL